MRHDPMLIFSRKPKSFQKLLNKAKLFFFFKGTVARMFACFFYIHIYIDLGLYHIYVFSDWIRSLGMRNVFSSLPLSRTSISRGMDGGRDIDGRIEDYFSFW
jgi:hypothetical protein